jgi:hypothetical protein
MNISCAGSALQLRFAVTVAVDGRLATSTNSDGGLP